MISSGFRRHAASLALASCLILSVVLLMLFFVRAFPPGNAPDFFVPVTDFDPEAMRNSVTPEQVKKELETIAAFGSRGIGQPGAEAMQKHMLAAFKAAGLEIQVQDNTCIAPVTLRRDILDASGVPEKSHLKFRKFSDHFYPHSRP